jgi:hypothetical protein
MLTRLENQKCSDRAICRTSCRTCISQILPQPAPNPYTRYRMGATEGPSRWGAQSSRIRRCSTNQPCNSSFDRTLSRALTHESRIRLAEAIELSSILGKVPTQILHPSPNIVGGVRGWRHVDLHNQIINQCEWTPMLDLDLEKSNACA